MIAWQNHTAGRLHNGLLWALGAICGTALTTSLARVFAPEAGLWSAILCALAALLSSGCSPQSIDHHTAQRARDQYGGLHHATTSIPPSTIRKFDHIFNHKSASAMGRSPAWRLWHAGTIQVMAWLHRLAFLSSVARAQLWHKLTDTILHDVPKRHARSGRRWNFRPQVGVNFAQSI